jgi:hypothetical protein
MRPCWIGQLVIFIDGNITTGGYLLLQDWQRPKNILLYHFDDEIEVRNNKIDNKVLLLEKFE